MSRRLVILTRDGLEHRYVTNRLCDSLPVDAVVIDVATRRPSVTRAFRNGMLRGIGRVGLFAFRRAVRDNAAYERALRRVLGVELTRSLPAEQRIVRVEGINSPAARAAVAAVDPAALLVYGTAIVRDEMLSLASDLALNMHTGISPRYRGADCALWPLVNGEPEWVGATVHECTAAIDGGQIFATGAAPPQRGDGVHDAFARAVAAGAEIYVDVVRRFLAGELSGESQDLSTGTEYRGHQRTLLPELRARLAMARLR